MNNDNCLVLKNFAFGNTQYKKGRNYNIQGEAKEFAEINNCAKFFPSKEKPKQVKKTKK